MRERCNYSKFLPFCFVALNFANIVIQGRAGETFLEVQIKERTIMIDLRICRFAHGNYNDISLDLLL